MITSELPSTLLKEAEFSVLDVETTGLSAKNNRVIVRNKLNHPYAIIGNSFAPVLRSLFSIQTGW